MPETKYIHRLLVNFAQRPADFLAHILQYVLTVHEYSMENLMSRY